MVTKISGPQQSFLIVTVICIVERRKKSMSPRFVEIEKYGYHGNVTRRLLLSIGSGSVEGSPLLPRNTDQKCLIIFRVSDCHSFSFDCKFPGLFICRWCRACWFKSDWWLAACFGLSFPGHWGPLLSLSLGWSLNSFYTFIMVFIWFRIIWVAVF